MAASPVPAGPWDMDDPRQDCPGPVIPYTDADTEALIDELVDTLVIFRCSMGTRQRCRRRLRPRQPRSRDRLPPARRGGRRSRPGHTWNEIAMRLATTASAARHHYAAYARSRRELPLAPASFITSDTPASDVEPAGTKQESPA